MAVPFIIEITGCSPDHCARAQRAATVMSLIQSAELNKRDPYKYLKDILERLPTQPASRLDELLPHHWQSHSS
jgi:hypothetical protein